MKIAPICREIERHNEAGVGNRIEITLVDTGQHYDYELSKVFFKDLEIPNPDVHLEVGSGTHAEQTGKVMMEFEKLLVKNPPDAVVVVGDVNSTIACAIATVKFRCSLDSLDRPLLAHVEAGLRSFDRAMPEEVNRILTDAISDFLFTPSPDADENLRKEGIPDEKIYLVGDVMVDSLVANREKAGQSGIVEKLGVKEYAVLTLHRPSNVDNRESLKRIVTGLKEVSQRIPIVYPVHPRTRKNMDRFGLSDSFMRWDGCSIKESGLYALEPLGYLDFLSLEMSAKFVLTDSGGIQEETTFLGIPCLTLRNTTERPVTVMHGTNTLVWNDPSRIIEESLKILGGERKEATVHELWDGKTASRIVQILSDKLGT
jgi:UDP-N-acetylglucosamine 2-epimerase (non-hydrolysing)